MYCVNEYTCQCTYIVYAAYVPARLGMIICIHINTHTYIQSFKRLYSTITISHAPQLNQIYLSMPPV